MENKEFWVPLESTADCFNSYFTKFGLTEPLFRDEYMLDGLEDRIYIVCGKVQKTEYFLGKKQSEVKLIKQNDRLCNACGVIAGLNALANSKTAIFEGKLSELMNELNSTEEANTADLIADSQIFRKFHIETMGTNQAGEKIENHFTVLFQSGKGVVELDGRKSKAILFENISVEQELKKRVKEGVIDENFALLSC